MSPRLASAITSSPAARAYAQTCSKARKPSAPSASKKASCGLTATTLGATASTIPRQYRSTASAACSRWRWASPRTSTGISSSRGSSPTTSWLRLRSTASASRSENCATASSVAIAKDSSSGSGCQPGAGREHLELRRRPPEEGADEQQLVRVLVPGLAAGGGKPRVELEPRPGAGRQG